jgi:hypothetical protein
MNVLYTSLFHIKQSQHNQHWLQELMKFLGKETIDDEPLAVREIVQNINFRFIWKLLNGLNLGHDRELRLFAVWCARKTTKYMNSIEALTALPLAELLADGILAEKQRARACHAVELPNYGCWKNFQSASARECARAVLHKNAWCAADEAVTASAKSQCGHNMTTEKLGKYLSPMKDEFLRMLDHIENFHRYDINNSDQNIPQAELRNMLNNLHEITLTFGPAK